MQLVIRRWRTTCHAGLMDFRPKIDLAGLKRDASASAR
jgi:hypothetical protein